MIDVSTLRRAVFHTDEEWNEHRDRLDMLLAGAANLLFSLEHLPETRERDVAMEKLIEFAAWARLAILRGRDGGPSVIERLAETVKP